MQPTLQSARRIEIGGIRAPGAQQLADTRNQLAGFLEEYGQQLLVDFVLEPPLPAVFRRFFRAFFVGALYRRFKWRNQSLFGVRRGQPGGFPRDSTKTRNQLGRRPGQRAFEHAFVHHLQRLNAVMG